ncbi:RING-type domain-containing protein [Trichonephila clavipes]|nr:RING-type domain-containing protein [Trichonephila clavipes]
MLNLNIPKCPAGENSWCFYQSAIANGENLTIIKLNVGTPINEKFLTKILPIYQRLASNELLERCIRCGTQNANESLHSMIWAKCPKEIFVNKRRVKRAVTEAVCEYNKGTVRTIVETQKAFRCSYWRFNETTCYYLRLSKTKI